MQSRWIAIGVVCFSAALLSACGGAPATPLASQSDATAMSKSDGRYDTSKSDKDKDDCDESEDHDKSSDTSRSLSTKSKDDDDKECKDSGDDHDNSMGYDKSSRSLMLSKSSSKDKDGTDKDHDDDDANCKVTICHVPPGNPSNEHSIRVGKSALRAHIEHGDYLGSCDAPPPPPPPPQCVQDTGACTLSTDCCAGSICMLDGTCGIPG
jgi:hypothetical protein